MASKDAASPKRNVLMLIGGMYHPFEDCARIAKRLLDGSGRYDLTVTQDRDVLAKGLSGCDAVMLFTCGGPMSEAQEAGLTRFVRSGGGLVAIHSANALAADRRQYLRLIGSEFDTHPPLRVPVDVKIVDASHQATMRLKDFSITEECYALKNVDPKAHVVARSTYQCRPMPVMYARTEGRGRVFYTALGHGVPQWKDQHFQRSLLHGLDWVCRYEGQRRKGPIRCAVLGYGPSFNMGKLHSQYINDTPGLKAVAACDIDPARTRAAKADFPDFRTFPDVDAMLKAKGIDLVVVILPHNLHARMALKCLRAGKHIITEKPFCLTVQEADEMIRQAQRSGVMLTVFHNRRWDGDFMTIRRLIGQGAIGEVFEISCGFAGYGPPRDWWRSDKVIAGGNMYDWGAHFTDWVLQLIPEKVTSVSGFFHKKVWAQSTVEDHTQAIIRFANGAMADIAFSSISAAGRPRWRILGTRGAILDDGSVDKGCKVITYENGSLVTQHVKWMETRWDEFYPNIADHLLLGDELAVKPQEARKIIGVIECAERSSKTARPEVFPWEAD